MAFTRAASAADAASIAAIDVETWRTTYAGMLSDETLLRLDPRRRADAWRRAIRREPGDTLVIEEADVVVGFGSCGAQRTADLPFVGEVFTLYVEPDFQGRGHGRQLLTGLFERLLQRGLGSALVWVLRENPSRFFYERLGGRLVATRWIEMGGRSSVAGTAYGWDDLCAVVRRRGQTTSRID